MVFVSMEQMSCLFLAQNFQNSWNSGITIMKQIKTGQLFALPTGNLCFIFLLM
jgi:hypothetical protein